MKNFAIIGAAGYVAPRHLEAIKKTGNRLVAAHDIHDSVGILDSYFPEADFFTSFERFDRHLEKLKRNDTPIDYLTVCSPNHLHDAHIRYGLKLGCDVICEKPIVLNPWNIDALVDIEKETGHKVFTILQLRLHPAIQKLKAKIDAASPDKKFQVNLQYITARGNWYHNSWKGDVEKSGGIATNIGIHLFDILLWLFGQVKQNKLKRYDASAAVGELEFENANVDWMLSIDEAELPPQAKEFGRRIFRKLIIDGEDFEFSDGLADLHTQSYLDIVNNNGFRLKDTRAVIQLAHDIRTAAK